MPDMTGNPADVCIPATKVEWGWRDTRLGTDYFASGLAEITEEYARDHVTRSHPGRCVLLRRDTVVVDERHRVTDAEKRRARALYEAGE